MKTQRGGHFGASRLGCENSKGSVWTLLMVGPMLTREDKALFTWWKNRQKQATASKEKS